MIFTEGGNYVNRLLVGFGDGFPVILSQAVECGSAQYLDPERRNVSEFDCVVLTSADGFRQVNPNLLGIDVERGDELDIPHVIIPKLHVHEPGHTVLDRCITIMVNTLHE